MENNSSWEICRATINDMEEMQQLFIETISSVCTPDYKVDQINAWISGTENKKRWEDIFKNQFVVLAKDQNKIVGFCTLDKGKYIDLFFVHKNYQRKGIAGMLYDCIEKEAKRMKQIELTSDVSITARPFFQKMGFNVLKQQQVNVNGIILSNFKMAKTIH